MKPISFIGQELSQLGTNTGPRDQGAPTLPTQAKPSNDVPRLIQLMALQDRIQPDPVSRSGELKRMKNGSAPAGFKLMDGEQMTPIEDPKRAVPVPMPVATPAPAKPNGEAPPRKYVWRERHRVTFKVGFMTVTVPAISIRIEDPVVMIFTPIDHDTRIEPPRGERIEMTVRSIEDESLPIAQGEAATLQSTGIYMDVPVFRARCGIFFLLEA